MKKQPKKLTLTRETINNLLSVVRGGEEDPKCTVYTTSCYVVL